MDSHVLVPLLEPVVFLDVVEVIPADDDGPGHLHLGDGSGQDAPTDRAVAGEGTLLVNERSIDLNRHKNQRVGNDISQIMALVDIRSNKVGKFYITYGVFLEPL